MKPRIFASDATQFDSLGLGGLPDAISCTVTEDLCGTDWRGGEFALEMKYPMSGRNYDLIAEERIICALPSENVTEWQPFRIYSISRPINGVVTIKADHVSRDLKKITCKEFSLDGEVSDVFAYLLTWANPVNNFSYVKSGNDYSGSFAFEVPRTVYDILCGQTCLLDQYTPISAECYTFDGWTVTLGSRGQNKGISITYGKNMTAIDKVSDMTDTITGYMPYWKDDQQTVRRLSSLGTYDDIVLSSNHASYVSDMIAPLDVSSVYNEYKSSSSSVLAGKIQDYVLAQLDRTSPLPATIDVKFVALNNTDQYKDAMNARTVNLGDTVTVKYLALGIDEQQRVIKTVYDVLLGRYKEIEIGSKQIDLAGVIAKIAKRSRG